MNREEVGALLAIISSADKRRMFDDLDVTTWHHLVGDCSFAEARDAVVQHYRSSTQSVMPAEILVRVNKERAKRRESVVEPPAPFDPNTEQAKCREWSAIWNHQIGLGATSEAAAAYAMSVVSGHPSSRQAPEVER